MLIKMDLNGCFQPLNGREQPFHVLAKYVAKKRVEKILNLLNFLGRTIWLQ